MITAFATHARKEEASPSWYLPLILPVGTAIPPVFQVPHSTSQILTLINGTLKGTLIWRTTHIPNPRPSSLNGGCLGGLIGVLVVDTEVHTLRLEEIQEGYSAPKGS